MTKVKRTKPSAALLAKRRAKEICTPVMDSAYKDRRAFINSVSPFIKGEKEELKFFKVKVMSIFTGASDQDRVAV